MKKYILKIFSVILLAAFLLSTFQTVPVQASTGRTAKIYDYSNEVTLKRGKTTLDVYKGMRLKEGDTVKTGKDSNAYIELDNDKVVKLDASTVVTISNLSGDADSGSTNISLSSGKIFNDIKKKLTQNSTYKVRTPNAVMGVRGTLFFVGYNDLGGRTGETNVAVLDGTVVATAYRAPHSPVDVGENQTLNTGDLTPDEKLRVRELDVKTLDLFILETIMENPELNKNLEKKLQESDTKIEELLLKAKERDEELKKQEELKQAKEQQVAASNSGDQNSSDSGDSPSDNTGVTPPTDTDNGQHSNNAKLLGITVSGGELLPSFNSSTTNYDVVIERTQTSISLTVEKEDSNASIKVAFGPSEVALLNGAYVIGPFDRVTQASIEVTAQNGNNREYVLNIIKKDSCVDCNQPGIFYKGDGSATHPYEVSTIEQLNHVREHLGASYIQTADIVFGSTDDFEPIGSSFTVGEYFSGSYNGNGYKINALNISSNENLVGLFGYSQGTLSNIRLENIEVKGTGNGTIVFIGGLVGYNCNIVENCYVSGSVSIPADTGGYTKINLGGIVGFHNNGQNISNCTNAALVTANISSTTTTAIYAGGIAGVNGGGIVSCRNTGSVSISSINANLNVGGITGSNSNEDVPAGTAGNVNALLQNGEISLSSNAGYICANADYNNVMLGGIAGNNLNSIQTSYNIGKVEGYKNNNYYGDYNHYDTYIGGISGKHTGNAAAIIQNCYNAGQVTTLNHGDIYSLAGIVGGGDSDIKYCYNVGDISYMNSDYFISYGNSIIGQALSDPATFVTGCYGLIASNEFGNGNYNFTLSSSNKIEQLAQAFNTTNATTLWQQGNSSYIYPQLENNLHQDLIEEALLTDLVITAETLDSDYEMGTNATSSAIIMDNSNAAAAISFGNSTFEYAYIFEDSMSYNNVYISADAASGCVVEISYESNGLSGVLQESTGSNEVVLLSSGTIYYIEGFYSTMILKIKVSKGDVTSTYTVGLCNYRY